VRALLPRDSLGNMPIQSISAMAPAVTNSCHMNFIINRPASTIVSTMAPAGTNSCHMNFIINRPASTIVPTWFSSFTACTT